MMGDIVMSSKELQRVRVMERVIGGALTLVEASEYLGLSYRHSKRLKDMYRKSGPVGLVHGNRGRQPANSLDQSVKDQIQDLSQGKYADSNDSHFTEMLSEREGITVSRETVRKIRRTSGQKAKRKRRPLKHRSRRPRKACQGNAGAMGWQSSQMVWR